MLYRTAGLLLCLLAPHASAKDILTTSESTRVARVEVTTISLGAHRDLQIKYCSQALHLSNAQAKGRLLSHQKGLALNACTPLLKNTTCRAAFQKRGAKRSSRPRTFRKITKQCAKAYCPTFLKKDRARLCGNTNTPHTAAWTLDFYSTAIRQNFLRTNYVPGLLLAEDLASAFVITP